MCHDITSSRHLQTTLTKNIQSLNFKIHSHTLIGILHGKTYHQRDY